MCAPEPTDPQDAVVAKQFMENNALYHKTAKEWVMTYACPDSIEKTKISKLMEMGFDDATSKNALEKNGWDVETAINSLLG